LWFLALSNAPFKEHIPSRVVPLPSGATPA